MLGNDHAVAVLRREHSAGVEAHAERGYVRAQLDRRRYRVGARARIAELRVRDVAFMTERIAEVLSRCRGVVQFVTGDIVAEPVAAVVREPQVVRVRVPVEKPTVLRTPRAYTSALEPSGRIRR